jgi:hypothetical protein
MISWFQNLIANSKLAPLHLGGLRYYGGGSGGGSGGGYSSSGGGGNGGDTMDDLLAAMGGAGPTRPPPAPPSRSAASTEEEDAAAEHCTTEMECIVCLDARRGSVLVPCGHANMCMPCAQELIGGGLSVQVESSWTHSFESTPVSVVFATRERV